MREALQSLRRQRQEAAGRAEDAEEGEEARRGPATAFERTPPRQQGRPDPVAW